MVIRLYTFFALILLSCASCEKDREELSLLKTAYSGNELRIDGYYYSNPTPADDIGVAVFYRDGVCINVYTRVEDQDTLSFIENDILLNPSIISNFMSTPTNIGVYQINAPSIVFETWEAGRDIITFSNYGWILNDTTFLITKQVNNNTGTATYDNLTYHFRQFSPKPDSTNAFIK